MKRSEQREILARRVAELRRESYATLRARFLDNPVNEEVVGADGVVHGVEIGAYEDVGDDLRVIVSVGSSIAPPTGGFVVARDGALDP